jgi:hypothetical protein
LLMETHIIDPLGQAEPRARAQDRERTSQRLKRFAALNRS